MVHRDEVFLVGDVGGTNVRLGLAHRGADGKICVANIRKLPGHHYDNLDAAISEYFSKLQTPPKNASLALAGPIHQGRVKLTNKDWTVSQSGLRQKFGFDEVQIHNDFSAMARAVPECNEDDFTVLNSGIADPAAPILVAGPGTGFGMAILVPTDHCWRVLSSEGGHQAYAPQTRKESDILHILQKEHDFVSLELVSAGRGVDTVHKAVCTRLGQPYERLSPAHIRERALAGDTACRDVCEIRANAIMGALGDMALAIGARGGVVLAGGVAKRLLEFIDTPSAMKRFFNRGLQKAYVKNISLRVLQKPAAALYGAAALHLDASHGS